MRLHSLRVGAPSAFEAAFVERVTEQAQAVIVMPGPIFTAPGSAVMPDLAAKHRLPTMFEDRGVFCM